MANALEEFRGKLGSQKTHRRYRDVFCESSDYEAWFGFGILFVILNVVLPLAIVGGTCYYTIKQVIICLIVRC